MTSREAFCYIQARGGSKRFPHKNMAYFNGEPMLQRAIRTAFDSQVFDRVVVTSDDEDILAFAQRCGAEPSKDEHSDTTIDNDIALQVVPKYSGYTYGCKLYPCTPLLSPERLREGYETIKTGFDAVYSVAEFDQRPQRAYRMVGGRIEFVNPEYAETPSCELEPMYYDAGAFVFFRVSAFLQHRSLRFHNTGAVVLGMFEHQDIDYEDDLRMAEVKYESLVSH